ncbi:MAG: YmdB family metallophosphoesterase [Candidatus Ozemobacteraceae bacterium]
MQAFLFLGEILHELPFEALKRLLDDPKRPAADFVVLNGNGILGGAGRLTEVFERLFESGIDVITLGEQALARASSRDLLNRFPKLLRPLNVPPHAPGYGHLIIKRENTSFWVVVIATPTEKRPLDDPFSALEAWITGPGRDIPGFVQMTGNDLATKQALFWRFSRSSPPIHWIGTGLGWASRRSSIREGNIFVPDIGIIGAEGCISGLDPKLWWKKNREHFPVEHLPPSTRILADGVFLRLQQTWKISSHEPVSLPSESGFEDFSSF